MGKETDSFRLVGKLLKANGKKATWFMESVPTETTLTTRVTGWVGDLMAWARNGFLRIRSTQGCSFSADPGVMERR